MIIMVDHIRSLVTSGKFDAAVKRCSDIELQPHAFAVHENDMSLFYSQYLSLLLVVGHVEEAGCLWLRAPDSVKNGSAIFDAVWTIGKCLCDQDPAGAHAAIGSASFPQEVQVVVNELSSLMRHTELAVVSKVYSRIRLAELATRLGLPSDADAGGAAEAATLARSIGWTVDEQAGEVEVDSNYKLPASSHGVGSGSSSNSSGSGAAGGLIHRLSTYVAHFETKPLMVDVNAVTKDKTTAGGAGAAAPAAPTDAATTAVACAGTQ